MRGARHTSDPAVVSIIVAARAKSRLDLFANHLAQRSFHELNTPFSIERNSSAKYYPDLLLKEESKDQLHQKLLEQHRPREQRRNSSYPPNTKQQDKSKMSSQPSHATLLIPGPIEVEDDVLQAMSHFRYDDHLKKDNRGL